jgi:hypothetical protein
MGCSYPCVQCQKTAVLFHSSYLVSKNCGPVLTSKECVVTDDATAAERETRFGADEQNVPCRRRPSTG